MTPFPVLTITQKQQDDMAICRSKYWQFNDYPFATNSIIFPHAIESNPN